MSDGSVPYFRPGRTNDQRTRAGSVLPEGEGPQSGPPDLLAGVSDAVYRLDPLGRFTYLNPSAEALLERRAEDLLGREALGCFPTVRGSVVEDRFRSVLADSRPCQFTYFYELQNRWYELRIFPDPAGLVVFFRNVDARHRSEQKRDAEIRELNAVIEALPSATVLVDGDGRILIANRSWVADGELLRSSGIEPGGVGDDYLAAMSRGMRAGHHAAIAAGLQRL